MTVLINRSLTCGVSAPIYTELIFSVITAVATDARPIQFVLLRLIIIIIITDYREIIIFNTLFCKKCRLIQYITTKTVITVHRSMTLHDVAILDVCSVSLK